MKKAFTMAEAILVMTILGIIATIMISTLRPAEYKEKAMRIMATKVLNELDQATSQILENHSTDGTMDSIHTIDGILIDDVMVTDHSTSNEELAKLYGKYLVIKRGIKELTQYNSCILLKDGAVICNNFVPYDSTASQSSCETNFPGETSTTDVNCYYGYAYIDINGDGPPNKQTIDQFQVPYGKYGIDYDPESK